jgi:hypothetical protein
MLASSNQSSPKFRHPNKPLNPPPKSSLIQPPPFHSVDPLDSRPRLTRATLLRERTAFFDTRVAGRGEVWAAVRLACELIETGELDEAQAVIDASGCTCPSGDVWGKKGGIYDELGEKYVVPAWIIGIPAGVVDGGDDGDEIKEEAAAGSAASAKKEKGKGRMVVHEDPPVEGDLTVKVRLSHTARDVVVRTSNDEQVGMLLHRVRDEAEVNMKPFSMTAGFGLTTMSNSFLCRRSSKSATWARSSTRTTASQPRAGRRAMFSMYTSSNETSRRGSPFKPRLLCSPAPTNPTTCFMKLVSATTTSLLKRTSS